MDVPRMSEATALIQLYSFLYMQYIESKKRCHIAAQRDRVLVFIQFQFA